MNAILIAGGLAQWGLAAIFCYLNRDLARTVGMPGVKALTVDNSFLLRFDIQAVVALSVLWTFLFFVLIRKTPNDSELRRRQWFLILFFPVVLQLAAIFVLPYQSSDLFSYLGHGYIAAPLEGNPYLFEERSLAHSPIGESLATLGWLPDNGVSPYGPLLTRLEILAVELFPNPRAGVFFLKFVFVVLNFVSGWLLWRIATFFDRPDKARALIFYFWNPLLISQLALEGHNDSLLICLTLAGLWAAIRGKRNLNWLAQTLSVLTKYITVLVAPAQILFLWRHKRSAREFLISATGAAVGALLFAAFLFGRFWLGRATFHGGGDNFEEGWQGHELAGLTILWSGLGFYFLYLVSWSWRVRDAQTLFESTAYLLLAYVVFVSPVLWPWYYALPLVVLGAMPLTSTQGVLYFVTTGIGMLVSPFHFAREARLTIDLGLLPLKLNQQQWNWLVTLLFLVLTFRKTLAELHREFSLFPLRLKFGHVWNNIRRHVLSSVPNEPH